MDLSSSCEIYLCSMMHLNALHAYLTSLHSNGIRLHGKLFLIHGENDVLIPDSMLTFLRKDDISIFPLHILPKKSLVRKCLLFAGEIINLFRLKSCININSNNDYYLIKPAHLRVSASQFVQIQCENKDKRIKVIYLEEGIGSYIRDTNRWNERMIKKTGTFIDKLHLAISNFKSWIEYDYVQKILDENMQIEYFTLFNKKGQSLSRNNQVCSLLKSIYLDERINKELTDNYYKGAILINSQPFMEEVNVSSDIDCYIKIVEICTKCGFRVVLKPHPREHNIDRYRCLNIEIDESHSRLSQETLLANTEIKPCAIIGYFSTTLITAKLFWDIPAICLGNLADCTHLSGFEKDIESFVNVFQMYLFTPKTFEELEEFISSLKK